MNALNGFAALFIDDHSRNYMPSLEPAALAGGFDLFSVDSVLEGLDFLKEYQNSIHAVILDLSFPKGELQGKDALVKIKKLYQNLPVIMLTDSDTASDIDIVVECMRLGAYNYVGKRTLNPVYLFRVVQGAIENYQLVRMAEQRVLTAENAWPLFKIRKDCDVGYFKRCAVFGFQLICINKPADEAAASRQTKAALEWHYNLLKSISCYNNEIQLNLKFISSGKTINCYILFTIYATDDTALDMYLNNIRHDLFPFFKLSSEDENQPYLFAEIVDEEILNSIDDYPAHFKYNTFYRKPVKFKTERGIGFGTGETKELLTDEYAPDELFPFSQGLSYDKELFRALLNQEDYAEIDVQLFPKNLLKQEIDFIKQTANNITKLDTKTVNNETLRLYSDYLKQFIFNTKDKFLINVLLKRKSPNWEQHLKTGIKNYFFGLDADVEHDLRKPEALYRFCTSKEGNPNQLPFFYDIAASLQSFRLPVPGLEKTPGFEEKPLIYHKIPQNLPDTGLLLGEKKGTNGDHKIRISKESAARHMYIMGQTGTGKSTLLKTMIQDCLTRNEGFAVIDPHGDLYDDVLKLIPAAKRKKLFLLNVSDPGNSVSLNPLQYNPEMPQAKSLVINELIRSFKSLYNMHEAGGPMFESYFKNGLLLLMNEGVQGKFGLYALSDLVKIFQNTEFRNELLAECDDGNIKDFFRSALASTGEMAFGNFALYITSKLTRFVEDAYLSPILTNKNTSIDFRKLMDDEAMLLIRMDKGLIGSDNTSLLGQIIISNIVLAAMSRTNMEKEKRTPFYIFIDEFQNFVKADAGTALSEVRKYGLSLILANQTLGQLDNFLIESLLGNVGSQIFFRPGINDYERIKHYLEPEFKREDVLKLPNFNCIARLMIDNIPSDPFVFQTINI